ncbi:MAG: winged helix DNA-binding domain-containing protein [Gemmatimonadales bacterium]
MKTRQLSIADQRLLNQRITRPGPRGAEKVVAWLGAVQAQEYGPAKWGLALRSPGGVTDAAIERAIKQGRILRTHVLRPTWHFVTPADIRWMLELTAPRVQQRMSTYDRQMGLHADIMTRAAGVLERALGDHGCLTRRELGAHLQRAGLPGGTRELAHIAMYAELEGLVCSGPRRGKQSTYGLLADRAPAALRLQRDEAQAELTRRYLRSHGPATIRDFVWWSGLTTGDARRGVQMIRARSRELDGLTYWTIGRESGKPPRPRATVHLLPIYDEYLVAYRDHRVVPRPAYALGNFLNTLVVGGQVAGTWRTVQRAKGVGVNIRTLSRLTAAQRRGLAQAVARFSHFLGVPVSLSVT